MSLQTRLESLVLRLAAEFKTIYGQVGTLANLSTTDKTNLVSSITELRSQISTLAGVTIIDDANAAGTATTFSASKIVTLREAEPGTVVAGGQTVIEIIDPASLWVNVRIDQVSSAGLRAGLPARVQLRSGDGKVLPGRVLRIEPRADPVTEETLVKVVFDTLPTPLPPLGEYAEVTLDLAPIGKGPVVPNAAVRRMGDRIGVWKLDDGDPVFVPVKLGKADLGGRVQVLEGLDEGDTIIVYSEQELNQNSNTSVVERIPGVTP